MESPSPPGRPLGWPLDDDDEATLLARYETLGVEASVLTQPVALLGEVARLDGQETSVADEPTRVEADLSHLSVSMDLGVERGRGGMAEVHAATQRTLRRDVALKALREDHRTPEHARQLLSEARILAALEHPAIVPVYLLATDGHGDPVIVMRHIAGKLWRHFVDEDGALSKPDAVPGDALRWHVRVLATVCDAVHHAHKVGLLHRDLKLRNVLITENGDPYLLDWGLAAALHPGSELDLPWARDEQKLRGTPGYLAPEMAAVDGAAFGPWTDVYLLGGCLHAVLTGWPRHRGRTVIEQLASAYASRPVHYDPQVPRALAAIANRATARDPAERYPSAAAMRRELLGWLDGERVASAVAQERVALLSEQASVRIEQESIRVEQRSVREQQDALFREQEILRRERIRVEKERRELMRSAEAESAPGVDVARVRRGRVLAGLTLAVVLLGSIVLGQIGPLRLDGGGLLLLLVGELLGGLSLLAALFASD